ncbi:Nitrate/nitrite response regulator protein narL [Leminorella richardii]|uniref:Nitrate/nitrite response regulator protein narL n=1 Tax=Leminorella richardii TaxID=158841 RepID=A0A2X4UDH0_9GAMM|nr:two-component system response regulator NarL [Leminorella richardii]SQI37103.1 Nitrate/nitrite response regulator protein narL [Leminorella richardii]
MVQEQYSVLIVDDHPLMRRGVRQLLELEPTLNIVAEASNGNEAITYAGQFLPDLILLDLNMKGLSGLDTLKALRNEGIDSRIIVLTVSDNRNDIYALIDAGADGYLLKDSEPEQLLAKIVQATQGENVYSDIISEYLASRSDGDTDPLELLTERELDVLQEVARGMSNKQVASHLHISEETVKVHIRNMLRKLNVRSRVAATVMYLERRSQ